MSDHVPQQPGPYQQPSPPPNWNQVGGWQPGYPPQQPPPKKPSNGVAIALAIIAGLLVLVLIGTVAARSGDSETLDDEISDRFDELEEQADRRLEEFEEQAGRLGEATDDAAIEKLSAELAGEEVAQLTPTESRCIAEALVVRLGASRVVGLSMDEIDGGLPLSEASDFADSYLECLDAKEYFARVFASDPTTAGLPRFYVDCVVDELGTEAIRDQLVQAFSGEPATDAELDRLGAEAGEACIATFTPEQLEELAQS